MLDTVIIGSGPAGVSAAIYLKRFNLDVLVIGSDNSTLNDADSIENYYGFTNINGKDLYQRGLDQLKHLDIEFVNKSVLEIEYFKHFIIKCQDETFEAKRVILATGKERNKLKLRNYKNYEGKGLSYCATCDGFFYRDKKIGIIGDGEAMLHELSFLKNISNDITIFTDGKDIEVEGFEVVNTPLISIFGENYLEGIETSEQKYHLDGLFVAIGATSTFDFIKHLGIKTDKFNNIVIDENYQTNIKGLYAIGDAIGGVLQISKAVYDGMMIAHKIFNEKKGNLDGQD